MSACIFQLYSLYKIDSRIQKFLGERQESSWLLFSSQHCLIGLPAQCERMFYYCIGQPDWMTTHNISFLASKAFVPGLTRSISFRSLAWRANDLNLKELKIVSWKFNSSWVRRKVIRDSLLLGMCSVMKDSCCERRLLKLSKATSMASEEWTRCRPSSCNWK